MSQRIFPLATEASSSAVNSRFTRLSSEDLPLLLPAGWDFDHLFGQDPLNAEPPRTALKGEQAEAMELPQTATGFAAALLQALAMLGLGLLGFAATTRRNAGIRA